MQGSSPSAASGSGSSDRNLASHNTPSHNFSLGVPLGNGSIQNAHRQTAQGAPHTPPPSESVYRHSGDQIDAGRSSVAGATGRACPVRSYQSHVQPQSSLHGSSVHLHPEQLPTTYTSQTGIYHPGHVNSRADASKPSPESPQTELPRSWDHVLKAFLARAGLTQAMKGFEHDMLVMNPTFESNELPDALEDFRQMLNKITEFSSSDVKAFELEERKLEYIQPASVTEVPTPVSMNKSISQLLSRKRARNDASNRSEFLVDKRFRTDDSQSTTAARVDAKRTDRDAMMKFDIAKNDDGPLRRTMQTASPSQDGNQGSSCTPDGQGKNAEESARRHGWLDERLKNLEEHLALRYVPSAPVALPVRLQLVEEHVINLEREYPPWAALHFNQPRRGWPAPPRPTPVIVPSHLTSTTAQKEFSASLHEDAQLSPLSEQAISADTKGKGRAQSSLQRAVLEKLEVQKAMIDMKRP